MIISHSGVSLATAAASLIEAGSVTTPNTGAIVAKFSAYGRNDCKGESKCKGGNGCKTVTPGRGFVAL